MAKRASPGSDLVERLKVVGSVLFFAVCGLALTALLFAGVYGWVYTLIGIVLLVLLFLFWPNITRLFRRVFRHKKATHKPKRAM